jgi:hypothetical protein
VSKQRKLGKGQLSFFSYLLLIYDDIGALETDMRKSDKELEDLVFTPAEYHKYMRSINNAINDAKRTCTETKALRDHRTRIKKLHKNQLGKGKKVSLASEALQLSLSATRETVCEVETERQTKIQKDERKPHKAKKSDSSADEEDEEQKPTNRKNIQEERHENKASDSGDTKVTQEQTQKAGQKAFQTTIQPFKVAQTYLCVQCACDLEDRDIRCYDSQLFCLNCFVLMECPICKKREREMKIRNRCRWCNYIRPNCDVCYKPTDDGVLHCGKVRCTQCD